MTHTSVTKLQDKDATIVRVTYYTAHSVTQATGSSRRERGDTHNPELAEVLAAARALEALTVKLSRRARALMNEAENNKLTRASSKEYHKAVAEAAAGFEYPEGCCGSGTCAEDDNQARNGPPCPFIEVGPPCPGCTPSCCFRERCAEDDNQARNSPQARDEQGRFKRYYKTLGDTDDA
jgi:uncharacterized low-complexity protein